MSGSRVAVFAVRRFDAPREAVWGLWITPGAVQRWWGPREFTSPRVSLDFREGGKFLLCMRGAGFDGVVRDYYNAGEFREIRPMERIVMAIRFSDERGRTIQPGRLGIPGDWPRETLVTATFADAGGGTLLTIREEGPPAEALPPATQGWTEQFYKMDEALKAPKTQKIATQLMFTGEQAGKAEEAIRLYTSLFSDSRVLVMERYVEGEGDIVGHIKFSSFTLAGQTFNAMDSSLPHSFGFTPAASLFVTCESVAELDRLNAVLSEGGGYLMPLDRYPFAERYCWLHDRYGVSWQLFLPPRRA